MSYIETFQLPDKISIDLDFLESLKPSEQHEIIVFGKKHKIPRFQQVFGQDYIFSNSISHALPIPQHFETLIEFFNNKYNCLFNMLLINWYPNGSNYIGMHSDNEKQIIENSPVVTISFGATRKFVTQDNVSKIKTMYELNHNDVLVMCGDFQKTHKHGIPKQLKVKDQRVSITLRCFR